MYCSLQQILVSCSEHGTSSNTDRINESGVQLRREIWFLCKVIKTRKLEISCSIIMTDFTHCNNRFLIMYSRFINRKKQKESIH